MFLTGRLVEDFIHSRCKAPVDSCSVNKRRDRRHRHNVFHASQQLLLVYYNWHRCASIQSCLELKRQIQNRLCRFVTVHHGHVEVHEHQLDEFVTASLEAVSLVELKCLEPSCAFSTLIPAILSSRTSSGIKFNRLSSTMRQVASQAHSPSLLSGKKTAKS